MYLQPPPSHTCEMRAVGVDADTDADSEADESRSPITPRGIAASEPLRILRDFPDTADCWHDVPSSLAPLAHPSHCPVRPYLSRHLLCDAPLYYLVAKLC